MSSTEINIVKSLNSSNNNVNGLYNFISILCSIIVTGIILILLDRTTMFILLFVLTLLIVIILKNLVRRRRPYYKTCSIKNNDITPTNKDYSFPSLHVAGTTVLCLMLWEKYNLPYFFFLLIPACMISRMGLGVHYLTDCLGGFFIPTFIILYVYYYLVIIVRIIVVSLYKHILQEHKLEII